VPAFREFFFAGKGGGRFVFRFNLCPSARCALRLGEGPRALGFSIDLSRCRGVYVKRLGLRAWHKRRYKKSRLTGAAVPDG
jgi:hypothetical protein